MEGEWPVIYAIVHERLIIFPTRERGARGGNYLMRYDSVGIIREAQMGHRWAFPREEEKNPKRMEEEEETVFPVYFRRVGMAHAHRQTHGAVSGPFGDPAYSLSPTHDKRLFSIIPSSNELAAPWFFQKPKLDVTAIDNLARAAKSLPRDPHLV